MTRAQSRHWLVGGAALLTVSLAGMAAGWSWHLPKAIHDLAWMLFIAAISAFVVALLGRNIAAADESFELGWRAGQQQRTAARVIGIKKKMKGEPQ